PAQVPPARFFLREARVALTDGRDCGEAGAGFVRLNFAMPAPLLREAVQRMGDAVRSAT
ncbi:MAG: aminotransferase class I/II, partial [Proteobacteria bacterium]|nr:aminotransferase class I/II [Pseudomonadota bacterium]